ncbi:YtpR family tRNA-binding protein [Ureaplasma canigenitalium]|uniref:YtpR family tRNA-binding protein n=1 Tax=Ureaplasma canigenitalium TaxID=42092 RepID=UPI0004E241DB|nr:hypothetical protein [Ureaplasma canigenitalium]
MYLYYLKNDEKDVLIFNQGTSKKGEISQVTEDLVTITYGDNVIAFNLFYPTKYIPDLQPGYYFIDEELISQINQVTNLNIKFNKNDYGYLTVGYIKENEKIAGTHLSKNLVDIGNGKMLQIVCGAKNARQGLTVVIALPNTVMPNGESILPGKLMNIESNGMCCSKKELNIDQFNDDGIVELDDRYQIGDVFDLAYINR